jgi:Protein of unknown function (DUF3568)
MRQKIWRTRMLGAMLMGLLLVAGCVPMMLMSLGGAAAIGSYKWVQGTMEKDYPRPMQDTWNATLAACRDMNLQINTQNYTPTEATIEATQPPDTNVKIQLLARPNEITTVKVRFGLMGNADASAYFHRRIMEHLHLPAS